MTVFMTEHLFLPIPIHKLHSLELFFHIVDGLALCANSVPDHIARLVTHAVTRNLLVGARDTSAICDVRLSNFYHVLHR